VATILSDDSDSDDLLVAPPTQKRKQNPVRKVSAKTNNTEVIDVDEDGADEFKPAENFKYESKIGTYTFISTFPA
jgi:hypothetical protein